MHRARRVERGREEGAAEVPTKMAEFATPAELVLAPGAGEPEGATPMLVAPSKMHPGRSGPAALRPATLHNSMAAPCRGGGKC